MRICPSCATETPENFKFCPECGTQQNVAVKCPDCDFENSPGSKFCQECGHSLVKKPQSAMKSARPESVIVEIPDPPSVGITIEFPFNTAQSFEFAVKSAKAFSSFEQFGDGKKAVYRLTIDEASLFQAKELLDHLKGWRKRTVYVNGQQTTWDSVFSFTWSYERKLASYKPEFYCFGYENDWEFNIWGCMRANMPFNEHAQWFTYGKWLNNDGDWQFDKERIKHELAKNLHEYRFCPALNPNLIQDVLDAIPPIVNPKKNKNSKFIETYSEENNCLKLTTKEFGYVETKYLKGVGPNGKKFLLDIVKKLHFKLPEFIKPE